MGSQVAVGFLERVLPDVECADADGAGCGGYR